MFLFRHINSITRLPRVTAILWSLNEMFCDDQRGWLSTSFFYISFLLDRKYGNMFVMINRMFIDDNQGAPGAWVKKASGNSVLLSVNILDVSQLFEHLWVSYTIVNKVFFFDDTLSLLIAFRFISYAWFKSYAFIVMK